MKRYGMAIRVRPVKPEEYKPLHAAAWPKLIRLLGVNAVFKRANTPPNVKPLYAVCPPCQVPLAARKEAGRRAETAELFHML